MLRTHIICDHCDIESYIVYSDEQPEKVCYCPFCGNPLEIPNEDNLEDKSDE